MCLSRRFDGFFRRRESISGAMSVHFVAVAIEFFATIPIKPTNPQPLRIHKV